MARESSALCLVNELLVPVLVPVLVQKLTPACARFRQAPGAAPTYDSCGRAGGGPHPTGGKGEYVNTSYATFGQLGSTLPKQPSGAVWRAGEVVATLWNVRANQCAPLPPVRISTFATL